MTFDEAKALLLIEGASEVDVRETPAFRGLGVTAHLQDGTQIRNAIACDPDQSSADMPYRMLSWWLRRHLKEAAV